MRVLCLLGIVVVGLPAQAGSYSPSEQERRMVRRLVEDDVEGWRTKGDKALNYSEWPIVVRPEKLVDSYSDNEVAADLAFKGKRVVLAAVVDAIRKDAMEQPFLSLSSGTGATLRTLHARFPASRQEELAQLKKQQRVTVSCVVQGLLLSQPVLSDCALFDPNRVTDSVMSTVDAALRGEREVDERVAMLIVFGVAFSRLTKPDSPCLTTPMKENKQCDAELSRQMGKGGALSGALEAVRGEFLKAGLKWAALAVNKRGQDAGR